MPIIEWNAGYLLGIVEIDKRHKQMVQLLNDTYDEFRCGGEISISVLDELIGYAEYTFHFEEGLMREISYPGLPEHAKEHESFNGRIHEFKDNYQKNQNTSIELLWFLCNWVTHHLRETDAELGRFVEARNIHRRIRRKS